MNLSVFLGFVHFVVVMSVDLMHPALGKSANSFWLILSWEFSFIWRKTGAPGMVLRSNPYKTCKTSLAGVVSLFFIFSHDQNSSGCSCIVWWIRIAVIPLWNRWHAMWIWDSCTVGEVCWYWFVSFRFLWMWCLNKLRRFMSGAGIPDNCQIYPHKMVPIGLGLKFLDLYRCFSVAGK